MTTTQRTAAIALLTALVVTTAWAIIATIGLIHADHTQPPTNATSVSTVSSFNNGFSDAKADDCQQGFAPACAWLTK